MATPTDLADHLANTLGMNPGTCWSTWKRLRAEKIVFNAGRGRPRETPRVTAADASAFLLCLLGSDQVQDASDIFAKYANLYHWSPEGEDAAIEELRALPVGHNFSASLTQLISAFAENPQRQSSFKISTFGPSPSAEIIGTEHVEYHHRKSTEEMFGAVVDPHNKRRVTSTGDLTVRRTVTDRTLRMLGELLRVD